MKKICAFAAAAAMSIVPSFAAVELSGDLTFAPVSGRRIDFGGETGKTRLREICPVGMQMAATFFFGRTSAFNAGLNLGFSVDETSFVRYGGHSFHVDGAENLTVQAGPAFEFRFGRHSLFVSPGAFFNMMAVWDEGERRDVYEAAVAFEYGLHVGGGWRFWVVQKKKFGLGLDFGADWAVGLGKFCHGTIDDSHRSRDADWDFSDDWNDISCAQRLKVYTGVVFRLGD